MKKFLYILLILPIGLFAQTTYHIATDGSGDYTSPNDLPSLSGGDSVLFKARDVWRESWSFDESGTLGNYIYIGRYGEGKNPLFLGSERVTSWEASGTSNIWQSSNTFTYISTGRIFFFVDDSASWGELETYDASFTNLTAEYDYTMNGGYVYVYSTVDPDNAYDSVEVAQRERPIMFSSDNSYLEFNGLSVKCSYSTGIWGGYPATRGATDLVFRNDTIQYLGQKSGSNDYGISCFHSNTLIEDCFFSDCGRRAISINTYTSPAGGRLIENIIIRNNVFKRGLHTTSLDLSVMSQTGDTVKNVYFYNNIIDDSEIPAADITAGHVSNQVFIQEGDPDAYLFDSIFIVGNLFKQAQTRWINFDSNGGSGIDMTCYIYNNTFGGYNLNRTTSPYGGVGLNGLDSLISRNNIFYDNFGDNSIDVHSIHGYNYVTGFNIDYDLHYALYPSGNRGFLSYYTDPGNEYWDIDEWTTFRSTHSELYENAPTPANPLFTDFNNGDYTLQSTSTAIGAGEVLDYLIVTDNFGVSDTINKYDLEGNVFSRTAPSLGAYEYQEVDISYCYYSAFTIASQVSSSIDTLNKTIAVTMPYGTNVTSLTPSLTVENGTSDPLSGVAQNFTSPVTYTATALDGATEFEYTVTVTVEDPPEPSATKAAVSGSKVYVKNGKYYRL